MRKQGRDGKGNKTDHQLQQKDKRGGRRGNEDEGSIEDRLFFPFGFKSPSFLPFLVAQWSTAKQWR